MQTYQDVQGNYERGSQWRIWDLHVHTPASLIHHYPGPDAWEQFLLDLESLPESVKVLGINDYLFLDGYRRILAERQRGRLKNIETIFPVIELRIDKFGGTDGHLSRVNYHVLFSDRLSPDVIEQQFLNALTARFKLKPGFNTPLWSGTLNRSALEDLGRKIIASVPEDKQHQFSEPLIEGFNHLCLSQRDVVALTESHWFKNKCLVGVGKTEWADIKWNDQAVADKKTVINDAHIVFISATNVEHWRKAQMSLKKAAVNDLLLDCSDAHYLSSSTQKDRIGKCLTWIKADPTFEGLRHALREPESRIAIASEAPDEASKRERRTKIIQEIRIVKRAGSSLTETWFENKIPLNSGLVAIIGNKGKGKSALTDTIGLLGNCKQDKYFTFLTDRTFRLGGKNSKATHFDGSITWLDSSERTTQLSGASEPGEPEYVKYLPQQYLERICGTVGQTEESEFDREVKKVILSHIRPEETHNCDSLDSLIVRLTKQADENRRICKDELHKLNERIVEAEERIDPAHRQKLEAELVRKKSELAAHESMKPASLQDPKENSGSSEDTLAALKSLEVANDKRKTIEKELTEASTRLGALNVRLATADRVMERVSAVARRIETFKSESLADLNALGLGVDDILSVKINRAPIEALIKNFTDLKVDFELQLASEGAKSLYVMHETLRKEIVALQGKLDEPNRLFAENQEVLRTWQRGYDAIVGSPEEPNTIRGFEARIKSCQEAPSELVQLQIERTACVAQIYEVVGSLATAYRKLYRGVNQFIESHPLARDAYKLQFDLKIVDTGFKARFFDAIHQGVAGTFYGTDSGAAALDSMLDNRTFDDWNSVDGFLAEVIDGLGHNKRDNGKEIKIAAQLKKGKSIVEFYDFIFGLDYLTPRYLLQIDGKGLNQLSPGERGLLLLVFYLLIDRGDTPLVIDQPEENLDNQTIYRSLVPCLKEARDRRQVIIVTHNPNVAVVSDADQVICADLDKIDNYRMKYVSGSVENPKINQLIVDVLEGTKPAFQNREAKYM